MAPFVSTFEFPDGDEGKTMAGGSAALVATKVCLSPLPLSLSIGKLEWRRSSIDASRVLEQQSFEAPAAGLIHPISDTRWWHQD